jgi:hypothetical protein
VCNGQISRAKNSHRGGDDDDDDDGGGGEVSSELTLCLLPIWNLCILIYMLILIGRIAYLKRLIERINHKGTVLLNCLWQLLVTSSSLLRSHFYTDILLSKGI